MSATEEWDDIVEQVRAEGDPFGSPHLAKLYGVALRDGERFLAKLRRELGEERTRDLIHDLLADKLGSIVAAQSPRAFFCTALRRRAISWLRRGDAAVEEAPPSSRPGEEPMEAEEERRAFMVDAKRALLALSERDRGIVAAVGWGEDRELVAQRFGTTRGNVDQIVSRAHKRFRRGEP